VTGVAVQPEAGWHLPQRECKMKTGKLMGLQLGLLLMLLASLQVRSMSPRMYSFLEATAVVIGTTAMYEGMPASAFDWSY
jgi:hypothetical protein